jgi:hypothetical protein
MPNFPYLFYPKEKIVPSSLTAKVWKDPQETKFIFSLINDSTNLG